MPQWQFKLLEFTIREQLAIDKDEYVQEKIIVNLLFKCMV